MNFIWDTVANRMFSITPSLLEPMVSARIIDINPLALQWWEARLSCPSEILEFNQYPHFEGLAPAPATILWALPPTHCLEESAWMVHLLKMREICHHYLIFATFGITTRDTLKSLLGWDMPMAVQDLHILGDQLHKAGWQRPMVQSQKLIIKYQSTRQLVKDLMGLSVGPYHPLIQDTSLVPKEIKHQKLKDPVELEINIALAYNSSDSQVQYELDDTSVAIPLSQIKKRD